LYREMVRFKSLSRLKMSKLPGIEFLERLGGLAARLGVINQ